MKTVRTLIIDGKPESLSSASRFLATDSRIQIIGRVSSGAEALALTRALLPELLLIDFNLPDMSGLEVTRQVKQMANPPRVIMLTLYDYPEYRFAAAMANADGFISKQAFAEGLLPLIGTLFALSQPQAPAAFEAPR